jgi:RNA polymerase sigma-70 factor (ECF subfamily)
MRQEDEPQFVLNGFADEDAFTDFYRRTAAGLHRYVTKVTQDPSVADDVLQIAYLRLLRAPPMDDPHRRAYLYRAATTVMVDRWRRLERERRHLQIPASDQFTEDRDCSIDIKRLLERLSERERSLLWLAYAEGFDHREIALVLGISEKSVKVALFRVREKAKAFLRPDQEDKWPIQPNSN